MNTTVAIVDDHKLFAKSLESLVNGFAGYQVLFCSSDGADFIRKISPKFKPDIVLLDYQMPIMNGYETVNWLKDHFPDIKTLILSQNHNEETVMKMLLTGINGYILKDAELEDFKNALDAIKSGSLYYPDYITRYLLKKARNGDGANLPGQIRLTDRESAFLQLAASDLTYKEIAAAMNVSPKTVDNYRESLFKKFDVKNRIAMVMFGIDSKFILRQQ
jgi:DNA-binding NarL/FixJ family response regulator